MLSVLGVAEDPSFDEFWLKLEVELEVWPIYWVEQGQASAKFKLFKLNELKQINLFVQDILVWHEILYNRKLSSSVFIYQLKEF